MERDSKTTLSTCEPRCCSPLANGRLLTRRSHGPRHESLLTELSHIKRMIFPTDTKRGVRWRRLHSPQLSPHLHDLKTRNGWSSCLQFHCPNITSVYPSQVPWSLSVIPQRWAIRQTPETLAVPHSGSQRQASIHDESGVCFVEKSNVVPR